MRVPVRFTWQEAIAIRRLAAVMFAVPGSERNPMLKALGRLDLALERAACHRCRTKPRRDGKLVCTTCWNKGYRRKGSGGRPPKEAA